MYSAGHSLSGDDTCGYTRTRALIVPAVSSHLQDVLADLRERDARVIDEQVHEYVHGALAKSVTAYAGLVDGRAVGVWGAHVGSMFAREALVWLVASRGWNKHRLLVARHSRQALALLTAQFDVLYGYVQTDFTASVRWLEWLGFAIGPDQNGARQFYMKVR